MDEHKRTKSDYLVIMTGILTLLLVVVGWTLHPDHRIDLSPMSSWEGITDELGNPVSGTIVLVTDSQETVMEKPSARSLQSLGRPYQKESAIEPDQVISIVVPRGQLSASKMRIINFDKTELYVPLGEYLTIINKDTRRHRQTTVLIREIEFVAGKWRVGQSPDLARRNLVGGQSATYLVTKDLELRIHGYLSPTKIARVHVIR